MYRKPPQSVWACVQISSSLTGGGQFRNFPVPPFQFRTLAVQFGPTKLDRLDYGAQILGAAPLTSNRSIPMLSCHAIAATPQSVGDEPVLGFPPLALFPSLFGLSQSAAHFEIAQFCFSCFLVFVKERAIWAGLGICPFSVELDFRSNLHAASSPSPWFPQYGIPFQTHCASRSLEE